MRNILLPSLFLLPAFLITSVSCSNRDDSDRFRDNDDLRGQYYDYDDYGRYDDLFPNGNPNNQSLSGGNDPLASNNASGMDAETLTALGKMLSGLDADRQEALRSLLMDYILSCQFLISTSSGARGFSSTSSACQNGNDNACAGQVLGAASSIFRTMIIDLNNQYGLYADSPIEQILRDEIRNCGNIDFFNDEVQFRQNMEENRKGCMKRGLRACIAFGLAKIRMFLMALISVLQQFIPSM